MSKIDKEIAAQTLKKMKNGHHVTSQELDHFYKHHDPKLEATIKAPAKVEVVAKFYPLYMEFEGFKIWINADATVEYSGDMNNYKKFVPYIYQPIVEVLIRSKQYKGD